MITCKEFDRFLVDYLDNDLPWGTQIAMRWHFLVCGKCRAYLDQYQQTIALGKSVFEDADEEVPESVPQDLVDAVVASIKKEDE